MSNLSSSMAVYVTPPLGGHVTPKADEGGEWSAHSIRTPQLSVLDLEQFWDV
ncbi:hypothetical protein MTR_0024s0250 [Medicago truncatula]|uniref:Uncharacterized protein n=1 Tax=Medicago truncatula TaxID=3880 RepID=A0A072TJF6_MEDTR|nr:hypothetical protein MTR_0024s0250 [Medicago truncatula]